MKMRNVEIALMGYFDGEVSPFHPKVIAAFVLCPKYSRNYLRGLRESHDEFVSLIAQRKGQSPEDNKSLVNDIFRQLPLCVLTSEVADKSDFGIAVDGIKNSLKNRGAKFAYFGKGFMIGSVASAVVLIGINGLSSNIPLSGGPGHVANSQISAEVSANAEYFDAKYLAANYRDKEQRAELAQDGIYSVSNESGDNQIASLPVTSVSSSNSHHASLTLANNLDESVKYSGDSSFNINNNIYFRYQPQTPATIDSLRITHESLTWENLAR